MRVSLPTALAVVAMLATAGCGRCPPPDRPPGVPAEARWAGNCSGGVWIDCVSTAKEPFTAYRCGIRGHPGGGVRASGTFVLAGVAPSRPGLPRAYRPQAAAFAAPPSQYSSYDGTVIGLPDGRFLIPDGVIDYPSGDGHGRRVEFRLGQKGSEEAY